jgi:putative membrane protein
MSQRAIKNTVVNRQGRISADIVLRHLISDYSRVQRDLPDRLVIENILVFFIMPFIFTYKRFPLSNISYTLIFVFMTLHTLGSHWTYAEVPFGFWMMDWFGFTRNHFDRIVHFSFGLTGLSIRELLRIASVRSGATTFLSM